MVTLDLATERLHASTKVLLAVFAALTVLAFLALVPGAGRTDEAFAWTVQPAATAAFLGLGYLSGTVLVVLAWTSDRWSLTRVPLAVIGVFTGLTLLATLLHLDRFHLDAGGLPQGAAWFWLVVYVVVPVAVVVVLVVQGRPERGAGRPVPRWVRVALALEGLVLGAAGVLLYVAPDTSAVLWPWTLTPLTARAVASWLLAYALAAALLLREDDLDRLRIPAVAYSVFGAGQLVLGLVAVVRGPADPGAAASLGYLGTALAVTLTGAALVAVAPPVLAGRSGS